MRINPEYFEDSADDGKPKYKPFKLEELPVESIELIAAHKMALMSTIDHQKDNGDTDPLLTLLAIQGHQIRQAQKVIMKMRDVIQVLARKSDEVSDSDLDVPF